MSLSPRFSTSVLYGVLLVFWPLALGYRPVYHLRRWAPALAILVFFLACPSTFLDVHLIFPRFSAFFAPFLALPLNPVRPDLKRWVPLLMACLTVPWLLSLSLSNQRFDAECAPFQEILDAMEPELETVGLIYETDSSVYPFLPLMHHLGAWYQADKRGIYEPSFSPLNFAILRYSEPIDGPGRRRYLHYAAPFAWDTHVEYDYVLFATSLDPRPMVEASPQGCALVRQRSRWWLFRCQRTGARP